MAIPVLGATPSVLAQPARTATGQGMGTAFGQDFDPLPAEARERVRNAFRVGAPDLEDAQIQQRWNAMTPAQRSEALRTRDRDRTRSSAPQPGGAGGGSSGSGGG